MPCWLVRAAGWLGPIPQVWNRTANLRYSTGSLATPNVSGAIVLQLHNKPDLPFLDSRAASTFRSLDRLESEARTYLATPETVRALVAGSLMAGVRPGGAKALPYHGAQSFVL